MSTSKRAPRKWGAGNYCGAFVCWLVLAPLFFRIYFNPHASLAYVAASILGAVTAIVPALLIWACLAEGVTWIFSRGSRSPGRRE